VLPGAAAATTLPSKFPFGARVKAHERTESELHEILLELAERQRGFTVLWSIRVQAEEVLPPAKAFGLIEKGQQALRASRSVEPVHEILTVPISLGSLHPNLTYA
jgi:hypothetical protein